MASPQDTLSPSAKPASTSAQAIKLRIWSCAIPCPHCGVEQEGWVKDPRGSTETCEDCGKDYHVPNDVPISF
jgi:hypothetical protein